MSRISRRALMLGAAAAITAPAVTPIASALPAMAAPAQRGAAAGTSEALREMRGWLVKEVKQAVARYGIESMADKGFPARDDEDAMRRAFARREAVRKAREALTAFDRGEGIPYDFAMYGQTPAP